MIGKILGDRYEIIEQIGGGGMALVFKAKCHLLNRFVAIKILRSEFLDDEEFIRKFKRESQAAASLSHPNIMNIYDVGVEELENKKIHYIVMEYIKGKTLKEVIKENGKLSLNDTLNYSIQIAGALKNAHLNHIVHRDIKPQNIMINEDNRVKVTDFGIARAATSSTLTTTSNVLGSVHYFSPEQARGGYTDEKSDIYSLGIVMYEMITGKLPYDGETPISVALKHVQDDIVPPREIDATIPVGIESIILKCVQKRQSDRYENVEALINDLKNAKNNVSSNFIMDTDTGDQATRMVPIIKEESVDEMKNKSRVKGKNNQKNKTKKGDGGLKMILLAILLAFLVVTIVFAGWLKLQDFFDVAEVIVPDIRGKLESEAREEIEDLGLLFNVKGTATSTEYEPGRVISQSIKENSKVKEGFTIDVVISEGKDLVRVPGLVNMTYEEAEKALNDAGLGVGERKYEPSDITPNNVVMRQEPEAFTYLAPNSRVNLLISQGVEIKNIPMPNLIGLDSITARNEISGADLVVGEVKEEHHETAPLGEVFWQSYEPNTEVETKTAVDIYVSLGPEEVEEEPLIDDTRDEKTITLGLTPFSDREETEIKIIRKQEGIQMQIYKEAHKYSDGEVAVNLRGIVGAEFDIYFDGIYQFSQTITE